MSIFDNNRWTLLLWPIYLIYFFVQTAITGDLYDTNLRDLFEMQTILFMGLLFVYVLAYFRLRGSAYKTNFLIPMLMLVAIGVTLGSLFEGSFLNEPEYIQSHPNSLLFLVSGYGRLIVIPGIIVYYLFQYMLGLSDPLIGKIDELEEKVDHGNYSRVEVSEGLKQDSTLGPVITFTNKLVEQVGTFINEIDQSANYVISSSEKLASNSEQANASSEEVSSTSQSMSQAASQQAEMISRSVEEITRIGFVVDDIIVQIQKNSDVINQISLQTNILALNAGIEASRAGDYGRGFAVVAENVRRLSEESKIASQEIITVAGKISDTLTSAFDTIKIQIEEVAALSEETAASAEEVAAASEQTSNAMNEVALLSQDLNIRSQELKKLISK